MISLERQLVWGAAGAVELMWLVVVGFSSSPFLVLGAVLYTVGLIAFAAADIRAPHAD